MMEITAKLRYLRIAPRKVRLVADLIRGKSAVEAETLLNFAVKKATLPLLKLLKSATASARNNFKLDESNLYIQKISVDEGPKYKRWMPRARGQACEIQKKTSHITLILAESGREQVKTKAEKPAVVESVVEKEKIEKIEKPKLRPGLEIKKPEIKKPGAIRRIFKRKAF